MAQSASYFVPLVPLPTIIDRPGVYRTRSGQLVDVRAVSSRHDFGCRGRFPSGVDEGWHRSGRLYAGIESENDIVGRA